jgi:signal transduction histidine kinase
MMSTSNRATRAASLGLAGVVLCLAAFSIGSAYTTRTELGQAQRANALARTYERAISVLRAEGTAEDEYLADPTTGNAGRFHAASTALADAVDEITVRGGEQDDAVASDMLELHEQYLVATERILGAIGAGDRLEALRIEEQLAHPAFLAMQSRLAVATEQRESENDANLSALRIRAEWMLILAPIVFAIGFGLLLGLWRLLGQQQAATRRTYREIEQLSKLRAEFVSTVSHEFRTPLTGIQGFSEMMRDEVLTVDLMREYAGDINKDAQRLNRLINDMLDLDQLESGLMTVNVGPVDLNRILVDAAAQFRSKAADHPIELDLEAGLPKLSGDFDRLSQVVVNLLSNAIKYSPGGGTVEVRTTHEARSVILTVRDYGIGIPAGQLEKIFERYSRIETSATQSIQGTGLGLPIVRQIVQLFEGRVWATSESGQGSVFHVQLPLAALSSRIRTAN